MSMSDTADGPLASTAVGGVVPKNRLSLALSRSIKAAKLRQSREKSMQHGNAALPVAVIGLGSMGFGMATSLRQAGLSVTGFDLAATSLARFAETGGKVAKTPAAAAQGAEIVVSVVVNAAQTEEILFGADGVAQTMSPTGVFISAATMAPEQAKAMAARLQATGRLYLDAPISGGAARAAEGQLTILASGSEAA